MTPRLQCVITNQWILGLLVMLLLTVVVPSARAEPTVVPPTIGDAFKPDLHMRDASLFERNLELDDIQTSLLRTLFEEYQLTFAERITQVRRDMVTGDPTDDELQAARRRLVDFAQQQRDALLEELTLLQSQMAVEANSQEIMATIAMRVSEIQALLAEANQPTDSSIMLHAMLDRQASVLDAWRVEKADLTAELLENIRAICTVEQLERWPTVMRALRREKALLSSNGRLSGESIDLFKLMRQIDLTPDVIDTLHDTTDRFARQIDQAIVARDSYIASNRAALDEAQQVQDDSRARRILQQEMQLRKSLRDLNTQMLEALTPLLQEQQAGDLANLVQQRGFALIYRPTYAGQMFRRILSDLEPDHPLRPEIEELSIGHELELEQANANLYALLLREEPAAALARGMRRIGLHDEVSAAEDAIATAFEARTTMQQNYLDALKGMLPTEMTVRYFGPQVQSAQTSAPTGVSSEEAAQSLMQRFDKDGDGTLSGEERDAARAWLRDQRMRDARDEHGITGDDTP